MEIKVSEIYEKYKGNQHQILEELKTLLQGKEIKLYEFDNDVEKYDYMDTYNIVDLFFWEDDQIVFSFGPTEYDICSIQETDLIICN